jgi:lysozyme
MKLNRAVIAMFGLLVVRVCGQTWSTGVDVSSYQGTIDWSQVAASNYTFAFARVSDGTSSLDPTFLTNYAGIKAAGMAAGAYQFFEPSQDPVAQADELLAAIGPLAPGDLAPMLDVEVTGGQSEAAIIQNIDIWVNTVEAGLGVAPIIYTTPGFWDSEVDSNAFSADPLWVANWGVALPTIPFGWTPDRLTGWTFWQHSDDGFVSGISGSVDLDYFNGSSTALEDFLTDPPPPVPPNYTPPSNAGPNPGPGGSGGLASGPADAPDTGSAIVLFVLSLAGLAALPRQWSRSRTIAG